MTHIRSVTCHMGSHSVPDTSEHIPPADSFLLGAYMKVSRGSRMVTLPMTSHDSMTS